jgi:N6-adenosine-specific RNA methylase IME4
MSLDEICSLQVEEHAEEDSATRANSEPCLLAVRGRMPVLAHDVLSLIYAPVRRHSQKPDEQYPKIERLYDGPYLELFARKKHSEKWAVWGNEIKSDIDMRV